MLSLGVTGHRARNTVYQANEAAIQTAFGEIADLIEGVIASEAREPAAGAISKTRLHTMLADGVDQMAADMALARGWELVCPLPFGRALNAAINAQPATIDDARALVAGRTAGDPEVDARAQAILALEGKGRVFELADQDEAVTGLFLAMLEAPADFGKTQLFTAEASERVALAGRVMIEQSDIIIAVWDGETTAHGGGTGHTVAAALDLGAPVIWIDAKDPSAWRLLRAPESLATLSLARSPGDRHADVAALVRDVLRPSMLAPHAHNRSDPGVEGLLQERWRGSSHPIWHGYRRVEALFGGETSAARFRNLTQTYETPDAISAGSSAAFLDCAHALPGQSAPFVATVQGDILRRFAWFDGISARLSDNYRGGMMINFILAPLAIVGGAAYLPFASPHEKWMFALVELVLLATVLGITAMGQAKRWHTRWFQTRRVAEYFRHAPILLLLGVARSTGRWPHGADTSWPEWYARHTLREVGLPPVTMTSAYLRTALESLLLDHVKTQRDYHRGKADRLARAHHQLDRLSELMFALAVLSVAGYLTLKTGGAMSIISDTIAANLSKLFTFLGVLLPTFGAAIAGIRYFGDFERFSAISEVTAEKLDAVAGRIQLLLTAPESAIDYARVSELAHAADDIVVDEIENWQAVFGGKHITVPV